MKFPSEASWTAHSHLFAATMFITCQSTFLSFSRHTCRWCVLFELRSVVRMCGVVSVLCLVESLTQTFKSYIYVSMKSEWNEFCVRKRIDTNGRHPKRGVVVTRYTNDWLPLTRPTIARVSDGEKKTKVKSKKAHVSQITYYNLQYNERTTRVSNNDK